MNPRYQMEDKPAECQFESADLNCIRIFKYFATFQEIDPFSANYVSEASKQTLISNVMRELKSIKKW